LFWFSYVSVGCYCCLGCYAGNSCHRVQLYDELLCCAYICLFGTNLCTFVTPAGTVWSGHLAGVQYLSSSAGLCCCLVFDLLNMLNSHSRNDSFLTLRDCHIMMFRLVICHLRRSGCPGVSRSVLVIELDQPMLFRNSDLGLSKNMLNFTKLLIRFRWKDCSWPGECTAD
jgi:hypothetical protein